MKEKINIFNVKHINMKGKINIFNGNTFLMLEPFEKQ